MASSTLSVVPPLMQLDNKHQAAMKHLISTVVRSFYEPKHYILTDLLLRHHILRDDDLAGRVGLNVKDLNKIMATLTSHRIVQAYRQNEMKENQGRIVGKAYFWIDLQRFCNVIKWRISDMRNKIDNSLKSDLDNKGYICPRCTKQFTALEVDRVYDFVRNALICDICDTELVDNEDSDRVRGSKDRMQRFNAQMKWIRDGLRNIEGVVMPAFDVARYVREKMAAQRAAGSYDEDGLKIAQGGGQATQVEIHMVEDEDDDEKKKERQKAAEEKRRQNALPTWHTTSTISGEKTALGVRDDERRDNEAALARLDEEAKRKEEKAKSHDTSDIKDYYDKLISGDAPRKRKHDDFTDPRLAKVPRLDGTGAPIPWGAAYPGMPYGYPPQYYMGHPGSGYSGMPGYPMMPPTPQSTTPGSFPSKTKANGVASTPATTPPATQPSQSSVGTSRNTPSQHSDSDSSSQDAASTSGLGGLSLNGNGAKVGPGGLAKKKTSLNGSTGLEKRVSFAAEVTKRSVSPGESMSPTTSAAPTLSKATAEASSGSSEAKPTEEYNPWVKVGGKEVRARDVKEGDDELMTADEFEIYWEIKQKLDEIDGIA